MEVEDPRIVDESSPLFEESSLNFNFAPLLSLKNKSSLASVVLFAHSEDGVGRSLALALERQNTPFVQVRSGRHSYMAFGATTQKAAVLDISNLTTMGKPFEAKCHAYANLRGSTARQEEDCTLVTVGGGVRLFQLYDHLASFGYTFPGGSCPSVGVSGYVLGGGIGFWGRKYGMGAHNLYGATVAQVDCEGSVVWKMPRAFTDVSSAEPMPAADSASDGLDPLLWALRGGGNNNFGVVTSLTLRVFPSPSTASMIRVGVNGAENCVAAIDLFQEISADRRLNVSTTRLASSGSSFRSGGIDLCDLTVTVDLYSDGVCALIFISETLTYRSLLAFVEETVLPQVDSSSIASSMADAAWVEAVAQTCGCATAADCLTDARSVPNAAHPSYWAAMSVFGGTEMLGDADSGTASSRLRAEAVPVLKSRSPRRLRLAERLSSREKIERIVRAASEPLPSPNTTAAARAKDPSLLGKRRLALHRPSLRNRKNNKLNADSTCDNFKVVILDAMGCKVRDMAKTSPAAFPWGSDALYHAQIISYAQNPTEECMQRVEGWNAKVFDAFDRLQPNFKASYRNYPSPLHPNALKRYYGESLGNAARGERSLSDKKDDIYNLTRLADESDPLGIFAYAQGIKHP